MLKPVCSSRVSVWICTHCVCYFNNPKWLCSTFAQTHQPPHDKRKKRVQTISKVFLDEWRTTHRPTNEQAAAPITSDWWIHTNTRTRPHSTWRAVTYCQSLPELLDGFGAQAGQCVLQISVQQIDSRCEAAASAAASFAVRLLPCPHTHACSHSHTQTVI